MNDKFARKIKGKTLTAVGKARAVSRGKSKRFIYSIFECIHKFKKFHSDACLLP